MISSLRDAWKWYERVRSLAGHMERLGQRFWDRDEWKQALARDNRFQDVESRDLREGAQTILSDLDDLAVLLMFSVFEAIVRDRVSADVTRSLPEQLHPAVDHAIDELKKDIETGSFGRVTEAFKSVDPDLVEKVNQVRRYRNWVAHGRRDQQPALVKPEAAYERLTEFLAQIDKFRAASSEGVTAAEE
jgi:hypothetical protein